MNCFRNPPSWKIDREYLRIAAVYRCLARYGARREWAVNKLAERKVTNPGALVSMWLGSYQMRGHPDAN